MLVLWSIRVWDVQVKLLKHDINFNDLIELLSSGWNDPMQRHRLGRFPFTSTTLRTHYANQMMSIVKLIRFEWLWIGNLRFCVMIWDIIMTIHATHTLTPRVRLNRCTNTRRHNICIYCVLNQWGCSVNARLQLASSSYSSLSSRSPPPSTTIV